MALAMAGLGIVHSNNTPSDQAAMVRYAKSHRIPFVSDLVFKSPSDSVNSIEEFASSSCIVVTESGTRKSKLSGVLHAMSHTPFGNQILCIFYAPCVRTGAAQVEGGVHGLVSYQKKSF